MKYVFYIFIISLIFITGFDLGITTAQKQYFSKTMAGIQSGATSTITWPIESGIKLISSPLKWLHKVQTDMSAGFEHFLNAQRI